MARYNVYQYSRLTDGLVFPIKANYPVSETFADLSVARGYAQCLDKKIEEKIRKKDPEYPYHNGMQYPVVMIYDVNTGCYEDLYV